MNRYMLKILVYVLFGVGAVSAYPLHQHKHGSSQYKVDNPTHLDSHEEPWRSTEEGKIISVRITSSVAVERGKKEHTEEADHRHAYPSSVHRTPGGTTRYTDEPYGVSASERHSMTALPPALVGANIEFIKQLRLKKEGKSQVTSELLHPYHNTLKTNTTLEDSVVQASDRHDVESTDDENEKIPRARSIPLTPFINSLHSENTKYTKFNVTRDHRRNSTTSSISFNVVHDVSSHPRVYSEPAKIYSEPAKVYSEPAKVYSEPAKVYSEPELFYSEPSKVYSEPAKVYGEPELFYSEPSKVYSEPAKVYGEPSKVYSEPAKVYSEPAKVYGEPAKYYSEPASLHLELNGEANKNSDATSERTSKATTGHGAMKPKDQMLLPSTESPGSGGASIMNDPDHQPERSYEVDEALSVQTNGRTHGVQGAETTTDHKVGYVLEGNDYRKYRVEERTADGFIVGEYGVVSHNDGSLRGVRYTADGDTNPRLIYDALMKFLHLTK